MDFTQSPCNSKIRLKFFHVLVILCLLGHLDISVLCESKYDNYVSWSVYHGDRMGTHYSELAQIDRDNVHKLELAWTYECEPIRGRSTIQCNPLVVGERIFFTTQNLVLICVNAQSGTELWKWDPREFGGGGGVSRGMTWWQSEGGHDERLFLVSGSYIFCMDPETGTLKKSFGENGRVSLRENLGREIFNQSVTANTPGVIYKDLLIMGSRVGEGPAPAAPGHVRAYDVRSGKVEWIFHTIPQPGEVGYETWPPQAWLTMGGANAWGGLTVDQQLGRVYFGTGSASYDHYGGNREGKNLFANCVMSLDAATGEYKWHFQTVHHDLWDYDLPCPPVLMQVKHDSKWIDAAAQITKVGLVFLFERKTGKPLFPIEERSVPQSTIPGEKSWPTQPFPIKPPPFAQQTFTTNEVSRINPESTQAILNQLKGMTTGDVYLPPGFKRSVVLPQFNGGGEWGGAACDPMTQMLYVNSSNEAEWISMVPSKRNKSISSHQLGFDLYRTICANCHGNDQVVNQFEIAPTSLKSIAQKLTKDQVGALLESGRGAMPSFASLSKTEKQALVDYLFNTGKDIQLDPSTLDSTWKNDIPYVSTGHHNFRDPNGYPVNKRPWGTLNAIDLNKGELVWQVPLGTYVKLEEKGFPPTGTFNIGGPAVTRGGLVFIGSTMDERFRAFDKSTGEILWEYQLEAGAYSSPAIYQINGIQYIIVAGGGGGKPGTKPGNKYYAFKLPASESE